MPMEGWVKCLSPQNTSGVLVVNRVVAAESNTTEDISEFSKKYNKPPYRSCGVIQVSASPDINIFDSKRRHLHARFKPKSPPEVAKLADVSISNGPWRNLVFLNVIMWRLFFVFFWLWTN